MLRTGSPTWPLALAAGLLVFAIGCNRAEDSSSQTFGPQAQQLASLQQQRQAPVTKLSDPPAKKFVDEWFAIYRTALSDLTKTRGRWEYKTGADGKRERVWVEPEFGMGRIPQLHGHATSTSTDHIGDRGKLKTLLEDGPYYNHVWGFGASTEVMTAENMRAHLQEHSWPVDEPKLERDDVAVIHEFAKAKRSLAALQKGEIPRMKIREWDVQARLMRLTDKACLKCHVDNRLNDPVAVFVFATKPK